MSLLKTTLVTTALIFGSASTVYAQDAMMDKAKDMAVDKGADMAKDKAKETMGDDKAQYIDPAAKVGKKMLKGDGAKDAVMGAAMSEGKSMAKGAVMGGSSDASGMTETSLSTDEAMTAGKVIMGGGSTEDAAMAVAKKRAKDQFMDKAEDMVTQKVSGETVTMDEAVIESSTVVASDPEGMVPDIKATVTTTTTPAMTAPVAPQQVTVNCPSGTTAQPDGSCMITGDYQGQ